MQCVLDRAPEIRCERVPNGVDCEKFFLKHPFEADSQAIIFTGSFAYRPNRRAVAYFLREMFPRIRKAFPDIRFHAVGNEASKRLAKFRQPGFIATDFVADLRADVAKATRGDRPDDRWLWSQQQAA